jgi:hypothetical protein
MKINTLEDLPASKDIQGNHLILSIRIFHRT